MKEELPEDQKINDKKQSKVADDRLAAVRDLLFGQNVEEYRGEFKELRESIQQNRHEFEKHADDLSSGLTERIDQLESKLTEHLNKLEDKLAQEINSLKALKADRKQLASLLHQVAKELES